MTTRKLFFFSIALSVIGFFGASIATASASTLSLSPASGTYTVGATIPVSVIVSSTDQAINAVSGTLSFPTDAFSVVLLSETGSLINFWATEPSYSNSAGTVH